MAGIQQATSGSVHRPDGGPLEVGWVPQHPAIYSKLSVAENLRLFAGWSGSRIRMPAVERMLGQTSLQDRAGDEVSTLSGGNRQRVNIAVGLLADPEVLLLDEPSSSLDPRQRERLWEFIGGLTDRGTASSTRRTTWPSRTLRRPRPRAGRRRAVVHRSPRDLERAVGARDRDLDFESAFVTFLHERGH